MTDIVAELDCWLADDDKPCGNIFDVCQRARDEIVALRVIIQAQTDVAVSLRAEALEEAARAAEGKRTPAYNPDRCVAAIRALKDKPK